MKYRPAFRSEKWLCCCFFLLGAASGAWAELRVGASTVDITPSQPVPLSGQMRTRIAERAETPISVTALALESRDGDKVLDQAILVSCDLVAIRQGVTEKVRAAAKDRLPGFDLNKLVLNATHTHTAPVTTDGDKYRFLRKGVMSGNAYTDFFVERVVTAAAESWERRQAAKAGWGQGQAVVAQNRRATYADGSAKMYGKTNQPDFRGIEGYEDHHLDVLFFWDLQDRLIATAVNVPCPSQVVEGLSVIHADFWDPVRRQLRARHGKDLHVLAWTGAGGDQVPRPMFDHAAEDRMRRLRGLTQLEEMARRIVHGWEDALEVARLEKVEAAPLLHQVEVIDLPWRQVTEKELAEATEAAAMYKDKPEEQWRYLWNQSVVDRYETEKKGTSGTYKMELHALRLGDVAIATNEFELYTDYGVQMKARSPAVQTFLIQLAVSSGGYLPTPRAVAGGSYSAIIQSSRVGPDGGQVLVERTVQAFGRMWPDKK